MVKVKKEGIILEPTHLGFENKAVLNPTTVQEGNILHMFYRAVNQDNYSSVGYCKLDGPLKVIERYKKPVLFPEHNYEEHGVEDPRITFLDGVYYMCYTAYDGDNALIAYATSTDLKTWEKKGVISPRIKYNDVREIFIKSKLRSRYFYFKSFYKEIKGEDVLLWEKDAFLFPKKINNKFALVHRILPDIQVIYFDKFSDLTIDYWRKYLKKLSEHIILEPRYWYESRNIGGGCPPIETDKGWLMIYHAVQNIDYGRLYRAGAALLDKDNPCKIIGKLESPLFSPEEDWEIQGDVNNVVFPSGTAIFDDKLYIYYGAADKRIAVASVNINELLDELVPKSFAPNSQIGALAGDVFPLCKDKPKKLSELKRILKKRKKEILLAVGWLIRENKVEYIDKEKDMKIKTKE